MIMITLIDIALGLGRAAEMDEEIPTHDVEKRDEPAERPSAAEEEEEEEEQQQQDEPDEALEVEDEDERELQSLRDEIRALKHRLGLKICL